MQIFKMVVEVTVNTIENIKPEELKEDIQNLLDLYESGNMNIQSIEEK